MTTIKRISRLKDCGVFRDFRWPEELPDFGKYNLIYGLNGTGKTTLSRILRDLELRQQPTMGEVKLFIDGQQVSGEEFHQTTLQIRVFNQDFIKESVFRAGGGDMPPIFVLGKESIEKQKELERLTTERTQQDAELVKARSAKEMAEKNVDDHRINRAKFIKESLRASGSEYNEFDKSKYERRAAQMAKTGDAVQHRLSDKERESLENQHHQTQKQKVSQVSYHFPNLQELADKVTQLLATSVASVAIQSLKDDSVLAEWTRRGLTLHKERESDKCLFCNQPLPANHLARLEEHFNAEYERFLQRVDEQIRALQSVESAAAKLRLPHRAELYDDIAIDFDAAKQECEQALDVVRKFIGDLVEDLNGKKEQPFKALSLTVSIPSIDVAVVDRLNDIIRRHNDACDNFSDRVREAREKLALHMIAESSEEFVRLQQELDTAKQAIGSIEAEIKRLSDEIEHLERDITEHRRPAEELNKDLRNYLGHGELQLAIKDTGYAITRNGQQADNLSEGERTALALLYFLKSLEDRGFNKANGVVVLDDPVSSLDANFLYLAFGFIRERTRDAGQIA